MNANIPPKPVHESYLKHRREYRWKILAPVLAASVVCVLCSALAYVATFGYGGDVTLWAQIAEIWLAIPTIIFLIVIFAMVGGISLSDGKAALGSPPLHIHGPGSLL